MSNKATEYIKPNPVIFFGGMAIALACFCAIRIATKAKRKTDSIKIPKLFK